jgi:hypothetical protein
MRACALRMDSFFNDECYYHLNNYINYLNKKYSDKLHTNLDEPIADTDITMRQIQYLWKTDRALIALYTGKELNVWSGNKLRAPYKKKSILSVLNQYLLNNFPLWVNPLLPN